MSSVPSPADAAEIGRLSAVAAQFRERLKSQPDALFPAHAEVLLRLGGLLGQAGDDGQALAVVEEAVVLLRAMAEVDASGHRLSLVSALNALSGRRAALFDDQGCRSAADEAVALARLEMAERPGPARFALVSALIGRAGAALRVRGAEDCLGLLAEAVEVFKAGGSAGSPFLGAMIQALHDAAEGFSAMQRWSESVDARRLMVALFPDGAPPAIVVLLALALQQASMAMGADGEVDAAIRYGDDGVELARLLYGQDTGEHGLILAQALGNQAGRRLQAGNARGALDAVLEAMPLFHDVIGRDPAGALPSMIQTLGTMSAVLNALGMADQAAAVDEQRTTLQAALNR